MTKTHPCRKLVLTQADQQVIAALKLTECLSIQWIQENILPDWPRQKIRKRLNQLKRHGLIRADVALQKIKRLPSHPRR
jgi:hypothetical protein